MAEGYEEDTNGWLLRVLSGGLPQVLAGPAGKAISRLVGAGADIPSAWLEGVAQGIRDKANARSLLTNAIAERAAGIAVEDPAVMERAMHNMLGRQYRAQANKDAVAKVACESLLDEPATRDVDVSDDFMMKFERHAEEASNEDLRLIFGKLLAGEIRNPGTVAPSTLHFVSMLDGESAKLIERVLPHTTSNGAAFIDCVKPPLSVVEEARLEQAGFWSTGKTLNNLIPDDGVVIREVYKNLGFAVKGTPNSSISLPAGLLSRAGADLVRTVESEFDFQSLADVFLAKREVSNFYYGPVVRHDKGASIPNAKELFRSTPR